MTHYEPISNDVTCLQIDKMYRIESTSIKLDILESICKELNCSPIKYLIRMESNQMKRLLAYANEFYKLNNKDDTH